MLFISPKNIAWQNNVTLQLNLPLKVNDWWKMNYGLTGGFRQYRVNYTKQPFDKSYMGFSLSFSQAFQLPRNYAAEFSGWYNNTSYNGTRKIKGYGVLNTGIKKRIKKRARLFAIIRFRSFEKGMHQYFLRNNYRRSFLNQEPCNGKYIIIQVSDYPTYLFQVFWFGCSKKCPKGGEQFQR